ncbi:LuxR C-terminal-related transcriptional regulator [Salsuginibacillus kocurii]|uniref:LuxR C-terminal-related transcriptional regulator n=1 Tax=Salsuginibacillus kocurii TaxID=427078 RepID=UPI00037AF8DF|nr:LuxR C-terminal-related transcriptional regulator [Salsuginibacillus kocurii]
MDHLPEFDFFGMAETKNEDELEITHFISKEDCDLQGLTFSPGEGLLGRVFLSGEAERWEQLDKDPRASFFKRCAIYPKTLFCFPVQIHGEVTSLLFGGSFTHEEMSEEIIETGRALTAILENNFWAQALEKKNNQQVQRLTSLVEVSKFMVNAPDRKRLLYILVDISLNVLEGRFSCVLYKNKTDNIAQLLSRGEMNGKGEEYAKEVVERHFSTLSEEEDFTLREPRLTQTTWGASVLECPLFCREELFGVLCVGADSLNSDQLKEHKAFFHTLSILGGVVLNLNEEDQGSHEEAQVEGLHLAMREFDPDLFLQAKHAAELAKKFTTKQDLPQKQAQTVADASSLFGYSAEFLSETLLSSRVPAVLKEANELMKGRQALNKYTEADIVALIVTYIKQEEDLTSLQSLQAVDEEVYKQFVTFIKEANTVEQKFSFAAESRADQEARPAVQTVKEKIKLSPREEEVLELVIRGLNNRDIAQELYISDHTVKNHVTKIYQKLGVSDRANAISKVYQLKYETIQS